MWLAFLLVVGGAVCSTAGYFAGRWDRKQFKSESARLALVSLSCALKHADSFASVWGPSAELSALRRDVARAYDDVTAL